MSVCCVTIPMRFVLPWPAVVSATCSTSWSVQSPSTVCRARSSPSATRSGPRSTICRRQVGAAASRRRRRHGAEELQTAQPGTGRSRASAGQRVRDRPGRPARSAAAHPQPAAPRCARRGRRGRQPARQRPGRSARRVSPSTSACRTGTPAPRWASSTTSAPPRSAGRCSRCSAASAPRLARALCQFALDRNADAFEEIRPPSLVTTATLDRHRPTAQVRRRRVRHRARRPVVHPDGRGAADVDLRG